MKKRTRILAVFIAALVIYSCGGRIPSEVSDIDGNFYNVERFGDVLWTTENLNTSRYSNGDPIAKARNAEEWARFNRLGVGAYVYYEQNANLGRSTGSYTIGTQLTIPEG